ncbi:MAG: glycerol-3-phosphate dehydrogenase/oxidase [Planctomycetes bacterium]|nr:glycerol-3-phosphate dehydrogenase/oxidase [Planctomycetota bacterium]
MDARLQSPVLILGAGVNGAALARELVLNGVAVCLVDVNDIAFGASSRSTRLIHGGLRYLEYGDFRLVKESLRERSRLRKLAPQFVEPLRLFIPVRKRFGGLFRSAFRFLGGSRFLPLYGFSKPFRDVTERGLWLVRMGLWLYDRLAGCDEFPNHTVCKTSSNRSPQIDSSRYRWMCAYTDAQMQYPERFIVALLEDARQLAEEKEIPFRVFTYHRAELRDQNVRIHRCADDSVVEEFSPLAVINATGAWGDFTLKELNVSSKRLFGGTKGSHLVTYNPKLREAIGDDGLYAEAADGRLLFVLPFGEGVLVGTTDERFQERPEQAVASERELDYLIQMTNHLFPQVNLTRDDVETHYSGVRPLPYVSGGKTASVSRGHWIETHDEFSIPVYTLVGGKLTTARAFAEDVADVLFERLGVTRTADTKDRPIPGGADYPSNRESLHAEWKRLADEFSLRIEQISAMWSLCGNRVEQILQEMESVSSETVEGTQIPLDFVRWVIQHEWVTTLDDLIERRLLLVYRPGLSEKCLRQLAQCLVEAGCFDSSEIETSIETTIERLKDYYGKQTKPSPA